MANVRNAVELYRESWKGIDKLLMEKKQVIDYCLTFEHVYEDYPFHDQNWCVIRHDENDNVFAWIFEKDGHVWVNVKCDPEWLLFWRNAFDSVIPAFHLNKKHWSSIILDGTIPEKDIQIMIGNSYDITAKKANQGHSVFKDAYPVNLLKDINMNECSDGKFDYDHLSEDQIAGLEYILSQLKKREKEMILLRYLEGKTYPEIANIYERSRSRIDQIMKKALRKLRHPSRVVYIINGYEAEIRKQGRQWELFMILHEGDSNERRQEVLQQSIEILLLSVRSYNALTRSGIRTINDLIEKTKEPNWYDHCRNLGRMSAIEVVTKMLEIGLIDESRPGVSLINEDRIFDKL